MDVTMKRRQFVQAGIAAGAVALMAGASQGMADSADVPSSQTAPIPPVAVPDGWDLEADIVVIGAGGGGLNAASRARELGLSVIVLEKVGMPGGNTQSATMFSIPGGTPAQDAEEFAIPEYPYDPAKWVNYIQANNKQALDTAMYAAIAENYPPCFEWMVENYKGVEWTLAPAKRYYTTAPLGMTALTDAAYNYAVEQGAEFLLGTEALALVVDGDRVVGVEAEGDGGSQFIHANKAVLMCGGGFAANKEMVREWCPSAAQRAASCYLSSTDSGECFRMGLGVGAGVAGKNSYAMFDGGMEWDAFGQEWCHYLYDGATQLVRQPWLTIDCRGNRLRYIDSKTSGGLTDNATIHTSTPDGRAYIFFDANWDEYLQTFGQYACRRPIQDGVDRQPYVPEYYQDYHAGVQDAIDAGIIRKFDTIEELAEAMGLDTEIAMKAIDSWNEMVASGADDFTFPLKEEWLHPVDTPPYYGAILGGNLFQTRAGLLINTDMQVLDEKGHVIPGLYAGWYTAAIGGNDLIESHYAATSGVSTSFLGGYMAANAISRLE